MLPSRRTRTPTGSGAHPPETDNAPRLISTPRPPRAHSPRAPTLHPILRSSGREAAVAPAPPARPGVLSIPRRAAPVCAAKWHLCTELRAYLSKHGARRPPALAPARNPSPPRAHPATADKERRERRGPPLPGTPPPPIAPRSQEK